MLRPDRLHLAFAVPAVIAACGARSTLLDESGGQGGGAGATSGTSSTSSKTTSSTGTSSSTASGGAGGAPVTCDTLFLSGEPITPEPAPFEHGSRPRLSPATEDGALASVALVREMVEGPASPPLRIVHTEVAPWGDWPSSLGKEYQMCAFGGDAFAVAPAMPAAQPGLALLFYLPTGRFPSDMYLAPAVSAQTGYDPFPGGTQWDAWEPARATALARGSSGHLAAYQVVVGSGPSFDTLMHLALVDAASSDVSVREAVSCADAPFTADVVPTSGGFLVATAAGRDFGACLLDDGIPGPADEVQVIRVDQATMGLALSASFQEPDPLAHVALARRAGGAGAWLVWQSNGASALQPPPVRAVRLDETGAAAGAVFQVTGDGATTGPIAAAALGTWLAVAWVDALDPSFPNLRLDLFDETGAYRTGTSINTGPSWLYEPSLSLLPSPDGTQLLLAWSDIDSTGEAAATVRVARFSCARGL